jgi:DeoR family ulaG and ulaABCDEF operon transcriptional repressor
MDKADQLIVLVDSSKFRASASFVVCDLGTIDIVITDAGVRDDDVRMMKSQGIEVVIAR